MHWGFVIVGYLAVFGAIGAYTVAVLTAGRRLGRHVPAERRRFLD